MYQHDFIFKEGVWLGEGKLKFSTSPEQIHFYTKWTSEKVEKNEIKWKQEVELKGGGEHVFNYFTFFGLEEKQFKIALQNELIGKSTGKGLLDEKKIAWEFREKGEFQDLFEGFEVYELQPNGDYLFHAEYISTEDHRTTIEGRIWKKNR